MFKRLNFLFSLEGSSGAVDGLCGEADRFCVLAAVFPLAFSDIGGLSVVCLSCLIGRNVSSQNMRQLGTFLA